MILPEIPKTWLIGVLMVGMCVLRAINIDTFTTAGLSAVIFYLVGVKMEQDRIK
jgi:hypothetical protein